MNNRADRSAPAPHTALIVEDDRTLLNLVADILSMEGFVTTKVDNGEDALAQIAAQRYDLFVIDVRLPDVSGMALCAAARNRYGSDVVIFVMTAESSVERLMTAMELGADDFVPKPFDIAELMARIDSRLERIGNPRHDHPG